MVIALIAADGENRSSGANAVPFPVGTLPGDLVVVIATSVVANASDARFTAARSGGLDTGLYWALIGEDLSPLTVTLDDGIFGDASSLVAVYRGVVSVTAGPLYFNGDDTHVGDPLPLTVPSGPWSGALALWSHHDRGVPGAAETFTPDWDHDAGYSRSFVSADMFAWHGDPGVITDPVFDINSSVTDFKAAIILGLNGTPPVVRQYPRDSLGLAAGPRLYPPPRRGRIVGGQM